MRIWNKQTNLLKFHNFDWYKSTTGHSSRHKYHLETTSDNVPGTEDTKTEWQNQTKDQTTLCDLDMEKVTKTRRPGTEIRKMGKRKMEKYFIYLDVLI